MSEIMASSATSESTEKSGLRLCACDVKKCEAMCCHDGAYLMEGEEAFLLELVASLPNLKSVLPEDFVVDGFWNGEFFGRKTATRIHQYKNPDYPVHFPKTRCVFADQDGFCELEKLARSRNQHPWTFKPATCWLFPLGVEAGRAVPPPIDPALDPYRLPDYPGYVTVVPCGRNNPMGRPWKETLANELKQLDGAACLPILGSKGNSVAELLKATS